MGSFCSTATTASDPRFAKFDHDSLEGKRVQVIGRPRPNLLEDMQLSRKLHEEEASDPRFAKLDHDSLEVKRVQVIGRPRPNLLEDMQLTRKLHEEESRRAGRAGRGQPQQRPRAGSSNQLGGAGAGQGLSQEEVRQRQIEAAERRQASMPGVSQGKATELKERQQKDELLGKLTEHYNKKKVELPMGLNAASAAQLGRHWEGVRSGDVSAAVLAD